MTVSHPRLRSGLTPYRAPTAAGAPLSSMYPLLLLLGLSVLLPCCLLLCALNTVMPVTVGYVSPTRWLLMAVLPLVMAMHGLRRRSVTVSGAVAGVLVGQVMILANYGFLGQLLVFYVTGSRITKFRQNIKKNLEEDFKEDGQRDWTQVLCCCAVPALLSVLYLLDCGSGESWLDLHQGFHCTVITTAVLGSLSCANGDTFSSEVGMVVGKGDPWHITSFRRVPRGTNGAISLMGTAASVVGGALVGLVHYTANRLLLSPPSSSPPQYCLVWLGALGGLLGSLVDSVLGATLQYSGVSPRGAVVHVPGPGVRHVSGVHLLSNTAVNLVSGAVMAVLLPAILVMTC